MDVMQRPSWNGTPIKSGDVFTLHKMRGCRPSTAVCTLYTHQFGWELRLMISDELQRSQVCRSGTEWLDAIDAWKLALVEKGWS